MIGLVITDRPDAPKRISGIIVLIDPVYWIRVICKIFLRSGFKTPF
jgi:hypothetical protein